MRGWALYSAIYYSHRVLRQFIATDTIDCDGFVIGLCSLSYYAYILVYVIHIMYASEQKLVAVAKHKSRLSDDIYLQTIDRRVKLFVAERLIRLCQ